MQQVHLRINDAVTGQPTPVRLRITDADGNYYAPHGRLTEFATGVNQDVGGNLMLGAKRWAYINGACEILLPPGKLHIEVAKGPEYKPIDEDLTLIAGKMSLRLTIERWSDIRKHGWHSGDTRVSYLPPDSALLEAAAEDVAAAMLLIKETTSQDAFGKPLKALPNIDAFGGRELWLPGRASNVAVGTQNSHTDLGSLALLNSHRIVYPLTFGGPDGKEDWTLADWCDQCHRKKGLIVWTDPLHEATDFRYGEPLADLILGKIDAFEVTFFEDSPFDVMPDYYRLLDAGLIVPLVGASAKESNGIALGSMRTYAHVAPETEASLDNWIDAIRAGRTFISNGPLLRWSIDGKVPGKTLDAEDGVQVRVEASSWTPFETVELLWNGSVIASASPSLQHPCTATLEHELAVDGNGWLAARCHGAALIPSRPAPQRVFAHTSAVAVGKPGAMARIDAAVVKGLLAELDAMERWACEKARCDTPAQRERLRHIFAASSAKLAERLA